MGDAEFGEAQDEERTMSVPATERHPGAGVPDPEVDAELLLAHVLGVSRGGVQAKLVTGGAAPEGAAEALAPLVERRSAREPLQHILGLAAFRHLELEVGPGVFVPRPETELLAGWAVDAAAASGVEHPVVVDLCTGSGAIAKALADEVPDAGIHAVELDEAAHAWAVVNLADTGVDLRHADFATAFDDLVGRVDGRWRALRVDRVTLRMPMHQRFPPDPMPGEDYTAFVLREVAATGWSVHARITVLASAAQVLARINPTVGVVESVDEATSVLVTGADSLEVLAVYIGMLGLDFRVDGPPALVDHLRVVGERYARAVSPRAPG